MQAVKTKSLVIAPAKRPVKSAKKLAQRRADDFAAAAVAALNRIRETGERPKVW